MRAKLHRRRLRGALTVAAVAALAAVCVRPAEATVVIRYDRFGDARHPPTNLRLEQFDSHIGEMTGGALNVASLPDIVAALGEGRTLPDRTIAITLDEAYAAVYTEAWPRLKRAGLPFTLFVSTAPVDRRAEGRMSWDQIRALARDGVTIGAKPPSPVHMPELSGARIARELAAANDRFEAELGAPPTLFAYPYGEYSLAVREQVANAGYVAAFGRHSGVLHPESDLYFLPRFGMNESYGDLARFRLASSALPLTVREVTPADPLLAAGDNPPHFGFTMFGDSLKAIRRLACYASGQEEAAIERLGGRRVEVRLQQPFPPGRARINCTIPAGDGRWRWFGMQFYVPRR